MGCACGKEKKTKNELNNEFVPSLILKSDNKISGISELNFFDIVSKNVHGPQIKNLQSLSI